MSLFKKHDPWAAPDDGKDGIGSLGNPLTANKRDLSTPSGRVAIYSDTGLDTQFDKRPLLLIHSVNAAASAFEVKPLFDLYRGRRPIYALDLPGFGQSDRSDRSYSVRTMTDAVVAVLSEIRRIHHTSADVIGLSLSCEFIARAAIENPDLLMTLALISPTGFEGKARDNEGGNRGKQWLRKTLRFPLWSGSLFRLLTTKIVIRKFLEKTWGSKKIDWELLEYDYQTARQAGAEYAPYYFVSGYLFSTDILNLYQELKHPVWMVHGTRGDFVDYHHADRVKKRPNWTFDVFDTGAFPHFEALSQLSASYDKFLDGTKAQPASEAALEIGKGSRPRSSL